MTAIAGGAGGAMHVVLGIVLGPPVGPRFNVVGSPDFVGYVPLGRQRKIIVTDSLKVPLFPFASVDGGDIVLRKCEQWIGFG
jgi:hypothetical protein